MGHSFGDSDFKADNRIQKRSQVLERRIHIYTVFQVSGFITSAESHGIREDRQVLRKGDVDIRGLNCLQRLLKHAMLVHGKELLQKKVHLGHQRHGLLLGRAPL